MLAIFNEALTHPTSEGSSMPASLSKFNTHFLWDNGFAPGISSFIFYYRRILSKEGNLQKSASSILESV